MNRSRSLLFRDNFLFDENYFLAKLEPAKVAYISGLLRTGNVGSLTKELISIFVSIPAVCSEDAVANQNNRSTFCDPSSNCNLM